MAFTSSADDDWERQRRRTGKCGWGGQFTPRRSGALRSIVTRGAELVGPIRLIQKMYIEGIEGSANPLNNFTQARIPVISSKRGRK